MASANSAIDPAAANKKSSDSRVPMMTRSGVTFVMMLRCSSAVLDRVIALGPVQQHPAQRASVVQAQELQAGA